MTGPVFLEGKNIQLRSLGKEDADFIARNRNHPEMDSLLLQKTPMTVNEAEEMITESDDIDFLIDREYQDRSYICYVGE